MAYLILVRHGVTDWNLQGRWQGLTDTSLSEEGKRQALNVANKLKDIKIDVVYTSELKRTKQTYAAICNKLNLSCPVFCNSALNERDYGIYTGRNKWEVEKELGHEKFMKMRRGWNCPIPKGEALIDVYNRVLPFYKENILNDLKEGKNVLIISSGNTLRALIKYLENLSDERVADLELDFGGIYIFEVAKDGKVKKI